jgi:tRNA (guanine-N7-)-methyltransferase
MLGKLEKKRRYWASPYALYGEKVPPPGHWRQQVGFSEETPLILEVGCGKGDFSIALAKFLPEVLVIGMDRKADRLYAAVRTAETLHLPNVFFWQGDALLLEATFAAGEVSEIWLVHPDPYPKPRQAKHRLTHPRFLRLYHHILQPQGLLHLRTDDELLWHYSEEQLLLQGAQIHWSGKVTPPHLPSPWLTIETDFQRKKGGPTYYLQAFWPANHKLP